MGNGSFGDVCQTAARSGGVRSSPRSSRSSSRTSSIRSSARSAATSARRTASSTRGVASSPSASAHEVAVQQLPRRPVLVEEHSRAQGPRLAEQRAERGPELLGAEGVVLEERELPPVERLRERGVAVGVAERREHVDGDRRAEAVESRRLAGRLRGRDREHGADPVRAPVERLEEDRACSERR